MGGAAASPARSEVRRRPPDRRRQILHHASELFASNGFHAVRMEDIADGLGITARALYRHFQNKQDLLSHVILEDQDRLLAALDDPSGGHAPTLDDLLRHLIEASLDSLRLGPLWQREARHLAAADFARVRAGTQRIGGAVCGAIRAADTGLPSFRADVRAWAAVSIVTSPGHYDPTLPRRRLAALLQAASRAAIGAPGPAEPDPVGGPSRQPRDRAPSSRRELLLAAAARAFRERGFGGVSLDEFGIVGPAVYRYFDGKSDILETLIARLQDWIALEDSRALHRAIEDTDVVTELVHGYVRLAFEATDLLAVSVTEALHLADGAAERERRVRTDNIMEWVRWLRIARPDLPDPAAQALVHATRTMINDVVRVPRLAQDPGSRSELESCALAVLLATELPWKTSVRSTR
jgi:AcrR family transcriptional regulator